MILLYSIQPIINHLSIGIQFRQLYLNIMPTFNTGLSIMGLNATKVFRIRITIIFF